LGKTRHGFQNHGHELKYGNLILQDKKYLGIIFIQIYYFQIFKENMDKMKLDLKEYKWHFKENVAEEGDEAS